MKMLFLTIFTVAALAGGEGSGSGLLNSVRTIDFSTALSGEGGGSTLRQLKEDKLAPGDFLFDSVSNEWILKTESRIVGVKQIDLVDKYKELKDLNEMNSSFGNRKDLDLVIKPYIRKDFKVRKKVRNRSRF